MAKIPAPKPKDPVEKHKQHAVDFLARDEHKAPKSGSKPVNDEANP